MSRKRLKGTIKSLSGAETVGVEVVRFYHHPRYRKRLKATKKYLAHFKGNAAVGQAVVIEESSPISKRKRWRVVEVEGKSVTQPKIEVKGTTQKSKEASLEKVKSSRSRVRKGDKK